MKKKVITFLMAVFLVMSSESFSAEAAESSGTDNLIEINETNFPDPVLREYLSKEYDWYDGKVNPDDITIIDVSNDFRTGELKDLKGIELFPDLVTLWCSGNQITSLDVSHNPKLAWLECSDNQITSLDFSNNSNLTKIRCDRNPLTSLNISKNQNLEELACISDQLKELDISRNPNLTTLRCQDNQLTSLDVSHNPKLNFLDCENNQITSLDVSYNPVLRWLRCRDNQITSLDTSNNLGLVVLFCSGNQLSSLDLSNNSNISDLVCENNQITRLDLSNNKELDYVYCDFDSNFKELILPKEMKKLHSLGLFRSEKVADLSKIKGIDFSVVKDSRFDKKMCILDISELESIVDIDYNITYPWGEEESGLPIFIDFYNPDTSPKPVTDVSVSYRTHVQSIGWQPYVSNGAMAGTSGLAKRLEGININVPGNSDLGVQYTTHVQSYGWLPWSSNGDMSGTEGEAKRLEAIKIQLTGADKDKYDIYYRVHAQSYGWLGWAMNGAPAGTAGYAKRLEGIQVVVVKKGEKIDQNQGGITSARSEAYIALAGSSPVVGAPATSNTDPVIGGAEAPNVSYRTHVQSFGWQGWKYNGQMSGTSGQAKRLEGINIKLTNKPYSGGICYTTHVQSYGWQGDINNSATWKKDGEMAGTSGQAKRLEAIMIKLTGEMAEHYDVYYRVHAQSYGWLGWAKNGDPAGTAGYAKRLEGIQIVLVPKGGAAPANNYGGINSANGQAYIAK